VLLVQGKELRPLIQDRAEESRAASAQPFCFAPVINSVEDVDPPL